MSGSQQHDNVTSHTSSGSAPAGPAAASLYDELARCRLAMAGEDSDGCMPMSVDCSVVASPITESEEGGEAMPAAVGAAQDGLTNGSHPPAARSSDVSSDVLSPDSNDSGIQADLHKSAAAKGVAAPSVNDDLLTLVLPAGWQRHEDEDGPYYWHIKSGTIQRDPPSPSGESLGTQRSISAESESSAADADEHETEERTDFSGLLNHRRESNSRQGGGAQQYNFPVRYAVHSLGWVHMADEDLTPERSSKAVNRCIVDLSTGRNDINDAVGRWGDGKDLYMDLDEANLSLIDPQELAVLYVQPIHAIKVWGVGRENNRDFAYVARDRASQRCLCHVFRCEVQARLIANTLRDICKTILVQKSLAEGSPRIARPTHLPDLDLHSQKPVPSFPTPMEEPKKVLNCQYLGSIVVPEPSGVEMLNGAMEKLYRGSQPDQWAVVSVSVAPSTITITDREQQDIVHAECRVRYLSFMAIALRNVKLCGFVMHTAQNQYIAHVFLSEPSAGALCKTIEAACKLRYQKCLDAHQGQMEMKKRTQTQQTQPRSVKESIISGVQSVAHNVLGRLLRKADSTTSQ